jgi:hypothetical protein
MAYKVLRDDYTTDKTFRDFYEDRPDLGRWTTCKKIS